MKEWGDRRSVWRIGVAGCSFGKDFQTVLYDWPPRTAAVSATVGKVRNQESRTEVPGQAHFLSFPLYVGDVGCLGYMFSLPHTFGETVTLKK